MNISLHLSDPVLGAFGLTAGILGLLSLAVSTGEASAGVFTLRRSMLAWITTVLGLAGLAAAPLNPTAAALPAVTDSAAVSPWALTVLQTGSLAATICGLTLLVLTATRHVLRACGKTSHTTVVRIPDSPAALADTR